MSIERSKQLVELAPIIAAHAAGNVIQIRNTTTSPWFDHRDPDWTARPERYRVKPEPREFWVNVYPSSADHYAYDASMLSYEQTRSWCNDRSDVLTIKVREVIE